MENSIAGRVADVHRLLENVRAYVEGEYFLKINHALLGISGSKIEDIKTLHSHPQAFAQCSKYIERMGFKTVASTNTGAAAKEILERNDISLGSISSASAATEYGLEVLADDIANFHENYTRFLILGNKEPQASAFDNTHLIATMRFRVDNKVGTLAAALTVFKDSNIPISRIESCISFLNSSSYFLVDIELTQPGILDILKVNLENLTRHECKVLGLYEPDTFRSEIRSRNQNVPEPKLSNFS